MPSVRAAAIALVVLIVVVAGFLLWTWMQSTQA
jgi:hypothetical protein